VIPWPTSVRRRSPPWTSASYPDTCLDAQDGRGATASDVLNVANDLLTSDKFVLSIVLITCSQPRTCWTTSQPVPDDDDDRSDHFDSPR
jgi:hypothetical protein